jgi:hypothetical protein
LQVRNIRTIFSSTNKNKNKNKKLMSVKIKSIFEAIALDVFAAKSLTVVQQSIKEYVESKDIKEVDKKQILREVSSAKSLIKLQTYICNSLLKYEGMGVSLR